MYSLTKRLPKLAGLAFAALLAACSTDRDASAVAEQNALNVLAPELPSQVESEAKPALQMPMPSLDRKRGVHASTYPAGSVPHQFWVDPTEPSSHALRTHMVKSSAYTICDPARSGYGPHVWPSSCTDFRTKIQITAATFTGAKGRPKVDFWNELRVHPNLYGRLPALRHLEPSASASVFGRIDYCVTSTSGCANEALTDPTLATQRDSLTGYLVRPVRLFSGYNVWA